MIIPTFVDPPSGQLIYHIKGDDTEYGFSIDTWLGTYKIEVTQDLEAEGQGRELVAAETTAVSTDRYILDLRVVSPDGISASVRETLLIARYTRRSGYWAIASIGGVPAAQS